MPSLSQIPVEYAVHMIDDAELERAAAEFRRDGACVVRGLLDGDEVARLREGVDENLAAPSERALEGGGDGGGRFFEDFRNWTRIAAVSYTHLTLPTTPYV